MASTAYTRCSPSLRVHMRSNTLSVYSTNLEAAELLQGHSPARDVGLPNQPVVAARWLLAMQQAHEVLVCLHTQSTMTASVTQPQGRSHHHA